MEGRRAGRPLTPLDPDASHAARLGAELRARRQAEGLTLQALGDLIGYSSQHLSCAERADSPVSAPFITACDHALAAEGALLELLPDVLGEQMMRSQERAAARRLDADVERYDDDVDPTNRRGLFGAGAAAALGTAALGPAPAAARMVDPELVDHWTNLLRLLGRLDMLRGPHDVLAAVRRETALIADHRAAVRGALRVELMRVEARWADLAAWLSEDTGRPRDRDTWTARAGRLAQEAGDLDLVAFWRARQGEWAAMACNARAAGLGEAALSVRGASAQTRAWCARQAALGHALAGDAAACERRLHDAYSFLEQADSPVPPWAHEFRVTRAGTQATEACCWLAMAPAKAIPLYEDALRGWPRDEVRDHGLHRARLALACAKAGELDRAKAEGAKALAVVTQTRSAAAKRELRCLRDVLVAA